MYDRIKRGGYISDIFIKMYFRHAIFIKSFDENRKFHIISSNEAQFHFTSSYEIRSNFQKEKVWIRIVDGYI